MSDLTVVIKSWINEFIIQHDLCPFAKFPFENERIAFYELDSFSDPNLIEAIEFFLTDPMDSYDTAFLIFENKIGFDDFIDFFYALEELLMENKVLARLKLVAFHPEYLHGEIEAPYLHFSNRAPLPMVQLLNIDVINKLIKPGQSEKILEKNEKVLKELGVESLQNKLNELRK